MNTVPLGSPPQGQHVLQVGDLTLAVAPAQGGGIAAFRHRGFDLLRPWDGEAEPRRLAAFPLVPWSGRIDRGRFTWRGQAYQLPLNRRGEPHAIHGDGWQLPWDVEHATPDELALALRHDSPDAVFRYRAEQVFSLRPDRLELELAVTHLGQEPLPYGVGLHPYLNRAGALLSAEVQDVWLPDAANIPHELVPVPSEWSFRLRRPVAELTLDHNFTGWQGVARVDWPEAGESLLIEADPLFGHLVVYVPHGQPFFCVEPVSHAANAINRLGEGIGSTGLRVLEPGERLVGSIRLSVPGG